jgi:hypothetical protein
MKVFSEESALQLSEMLLQNDKDIKEEIEGKIPSVDGLASVEYVDNAVKNVEVNLDGYATETFVTNAIANAQLNDGNTEINLSGYATKDDLKGYAAKEHTHDEYLTEHQDLSNYALKNEIPTDYLSSIPDEYVTEEEMTEAINNAKLDSESVDLSDYAKKTDIPNTSNFVEKEDGKGLFSGSYDDLTNKPSIPEAYDDTDLVESIENIKSSLGDKADKTELHTHINKEVLDGITVDKVTEWDAKATETFVTNAIAQAQLDGSDVDLSGLATKDDLNAKADKNHNHDDKYQPIGNYLTTHQDISCKSDVGHKHVISDITDYETPDLSGYALKTEIPSTEGFATEDYVDAIIDSLDFTEKEYVCDDTIVKPMYYDIHVIPDKFNTGVDNTTCIETLVGGLANNGITMRLDTTDKGEWLYIDFNKHNKTLDGEYIFENLDLSGYWKTGISNASSYEGTGITIIYNNCKFTNWVQSYAGNGKTKVVFNNC